ncbi:MAG: hypothetical protein COB85_06910 [Bacteroidetes bacterium]|nr:MAG: hypothetical protein COB85_06910 [Bacteroidota bacterium]
MDTLQEGTVVKHMPDKKTRDKQDTTKTHSPKVASIMSAILPGLGQAYNKKYWKIPIIYAGLAGLTYSVVENNKKYERFREAFILRADLDSTTIDIYDQQLVNGEDKYSQAQLEYFKNLYHRRRDLSIIFTGVLYLLNVIDAAVDAHFFTYDISDDLSLNFQPEYHWMGYSADPYIGGRLSLKL